MGATDIIKVSLALMIYLVSINQNHLIEDGKEKLQTLSKPNNYYLLPKA